MFTFRKLILAGAPAFVMLTAQAAPVKIGMVETLSGPQASSGLAYRAGVRYVIDNEVNPQLASHRGHVTLESVDAEGVVYLRFGGGCHGCGMADVTLKQGIEKTLLDKVPGVTAVRDATDHETGTAPYISRDSAA